MDPETQRLFNQLLQMQLQERINTRSQPVNPNATAGTRGTPVGGQADPNLLAILGQTGRGIRRRLDTRGNPIDHNAPQGLDYLRSPEEVADRNRQHFQVFNQRIQDRRDAKQSLLDSRKAAVDRRKAELGLTTASPQDVSPQQTDIQRNTGNDIGPMIFRPDLNQSSPAQPSVSSGRVEDKVVNTLAEALDPRRYDNVSDYMGLNKNDLANRRNPLGINIQTPGNIANSFSPYVDPNPDNNISRFGIELDPDAPASRLGNNMISGVQSLFNRQGQPQQAPVETQSNDLPVPEILRQPAANMGTTLIKLLQMLRGDQGNDSSRFTAPPLSLDDPMTVVPAGGKPTQKPLVPPNPDNNPLFDALNQQLLNYFK